MRKKRNVREPFRNYRLRFRKISNKSNEKKKKS